MIHIYTVYTVLENYSFNGKPCTNDSTGNQFKWGSYLTQWILGRPRCLLFITTVLPIWQNSRGQQDHDTLKTTQDSLFIKLTYLLRLWWWKNNFPDFQISRCTYTSPRCCRSERNCRGQRIATLREQHQMHRLCWAHWNRQWCRQSQTVSSVVYLVDRSP